MAIKTFFKKLSDFIIKISGRIFRLLKRIAASRFAKFAGSVFKAIPPAARLLMAVLRKLSMYPPLSWIKKVTLPAGRFVLKYLNASLNYIIDLLGRLHLSRVRSAVESLQIFFKPQYITGLTFTGSSIQAVRVVNSLKGPVIDHTAISPVKKPDQMAWELIEFARSEGLEDTILVTCIPASKATIRQIPIPIENVRKLGKIVKYQMEPYVPYSIDDMVVDFLPSTKSDKVLTAGVKNQVLADHMESLAQAGLEPQAISLDDIALITLFHHASGLDTSLANAIIHFADDKTTVMIIKEERLMFIRLLAPGRNNDEPFKETINLFLLEYPDEKVNHILITGYPGVDESVSQRIQSRLDIPVSVWKPFDRLNHAIDSLDMDTQNRLSVPLGLALDGSTSKGKLFDLRRESFAINRFLTLKNFFLYTAGAAIVFLAVFTISTYQKLAVYKNKNLHLQEEMQQLYINAFPEAKPVKGQELAQMKQKVDEEARYKVLDSLGNGNTVLNNLNMLTQIFSEVQGISMNQLFIENNEIKMFGSAPSFETVDRLKQTLEGKNMFETVKLVDAKMDKKENAVRFNIVLEKAR